MQAPARQTCDRLVPPAGFQWRALVSRQVQDKRGALLDVQLLAGVSTRRVLLVLLAEAATKSVAGKSQ